MALQSPQLWTVLGTGLAGIAVALGAYGWHDLEGDAAMREIFMLGVQYHMWHALALLAVSWRCSVNTSSAKAAALAGIFFSAGIILFCGNLYGFAITGTLPVSGAAPLGGIAFMSGWGLLAMSAFRQKS